MEFLVHMEVGPIGDAELAAELIRKEAERARELATLGIMRRLWRIPGRRANWGIWVASNVDELHRAITSLPLYPYLMIDVHPLASHPNDPGLSLENPT